MNKVKQTLPKNMLFLGAQIWQGQVQPKKGSKDEGKPIKGVASTPTLMRKNNLSSVIKSKYGVETIDLGNVNAGNCDCLIKNKNQEQDQHYLGNLTLLDCMLQEVNNRIISSFKENKDSVMVTVGGDHSVGSATVHALKTIFKDLRVIWVDAHPDMIDPQSQNKYPGYHGHPLGHACGFKIPGFQWLTNILPFEHMVFIGIRDIDADQWINIKKHNIKSFTMDHVMQYGIGQVMRQAIEYLDPQGDKPFHISFDVDAVDPMGAIGTGTKFRGGLRPIEANHIIRKVAHCRKLVGLDVVEINVDLEEDKKKREILRSEEEYGEVSPTLGLGIDLIESIFTKYFTL